VEQRYLKPAVALSILHKKEDIDGSWYHEFYGRIDQPRVKNRILIAWRAGTYSVVCCFLREVEVPCPRVESRTGTPENTCLLRFTRWRVISGWLRKRHALPSVFGTAFDRTKETLTASSVMVEL
jgi:hypothetical protein